MLSALIRRPTHFMGHEIMKAVYSVVALQVGIGRTENVMFAEDCAYTFSVYN